MTTSKPGYLTTEFWLTVAVLILTNLGALEVPEKFKWIVTLGALVGYAISRGLAKYEYHLPASKDIISALDDPGGDGADEADLKRAETDKPDAPVPPAPTPQESPQPPPETPPTGVGG